MKSTESELPVKNRMPMGIILGDLALFGGLAVVLGSVLTKNAGSINYVSDVIGDLSRFGYIAIAMITTSGYIAGRVIDWIRK